MNDLDAYVIGDIISYCNFDTKLIMSSLCKNTEIFVRENESIKLLPSVMRDELDNKTDNLLLYGINNNSERLVKYFLSRWGIKYCFDAFNYACCNSAPNIVKLLISSDTIQHRMFSTSDKKVAFVRFIYFGAINNKNKPVVKFLIENYDINLCVTD